MPEIQVRTSADLLRRDTASDLHEPESGRPYSRVTVVTFPPGFRKKDKSHASLIFAHAPPASTSSRPAPFRGSNRVRDREDAGGNHGPRIQSGARIPRRP